MSAILPRLRGARKLARNLGSRPLLFAEAQLNEKKVMQRLSKQEQEAGLPPAVCPQRANMPTTDFQTAEVPIGISKLATGRSNLSGSSPSATRGT